MGRIYTCPFDNLSVTNDSDQDIFELVGAAGYPFRLLAFEVYSALTTDERVRLRLVRRSTTGSGGSAATEVRMDGGNTVAAQTAVSTLVTTPGTIGDIIHAWYWSQLAPLIYRPTPAEIIEFTSGQRCGLNLETAVAATRSWSGFVTWEEIG
jgi:hypothetical protein